MSIDAQFDKRVRAVVRKHDKMRRNGVVHRVGKDGLIISRARFARPRFPWRGVVLVIALGFAFKALLWGQIGAAGYNERVETLRQGTMIEQVGAWLLQPDQVTVYFGDMVRPYLAR